MSWIRAIKTRGYHVIMFDHVIYTRATARIREGISAYDLCIINNKLLLNTHAHVHRTGISGCVHRAVFGPQRVSRGSPPTLLFLPSPLGFASLTAGADRRRRQIVTWHWHRVLVGYWKVTWHIHADRVHGNAQAHLVVCNAAVDGHFTVIETALDGVTTFGHVRRYIWAGLRGDGVVTDEGRTRVELDCTGGVTVTVTSARIASDTVILTQYH